ncbi:hypothetical protein NKJ46_33685 [Mesorhizobium sp. M0166]|uniref:hypothetical protein n=1 Tax=Mesorhizobium sp. M0166 TaxID=2956902 RepID=UPI00333DFF76
MADDEEVDAETIALRDAGERLEESLDVLVGDTVACVDLNDGTPGESAPRAACT